MNLFKVSNKNRNDLGPIEALFFVPTELQRFRLTESHLLNLMAHNTCGPPGSLKELSVLHL